MLHIQYGQWPSLGSRILYYRMWYNITGDHRWIYIGETWLASHGCLQDVDLWRIKLRLGKSQIFSLRNIVLWKNNIVYGPANNTVLKIQDPGVGHKHSVEWFIQSRWLLTKIFCWKKNIYKILIKNILTFDTAHGQTLLHTDVLSHKVWMISVTSTFHSLAR